ncbi:hypothetical protein STEG23_034171 [Scotinomys teguina]
MEHEKEMSDMNKFLEETSEALHKCKEPNENTNSYRYDFMCVNGEHQVLEDSIQLLQKQKALLIQKRDLAVKEQHPFTVSQMRFENCQQELE